MFYRLLNSYVQHFGFPRRGMKYFLKMMRFLGIAGRVYLKKLPGRMMMELNPEEHMQGQLFWYGHYEKPVGTMLKEMLQPNSIFCDIGANIGYFSLLAAREAPSGQVIAFEPVSYLFGKLERNVSLNKMTTIHPVNAAIGEKEESRLIYLSGDDNAGMSSLHEPENYSGRSEMVKVTSLDHWFAGSGLAKIDLIKIDVEGNELAVLKGMKTIITRFRPPILLELNPETLSYFNLTPAQVLTYIAELSYNSFVITKSGKLKTMAGENLAETINLALIHPSGLATFRKLLEG